MDNFEKLEILIKHRRKLLKHEIEIGEGKQSSLYLENVKSQIFGLNWVLADIDMIKRNTFSVSDTVIEKMRSELV